MSDYDAIISMLAARVGVDITREYHDRIVLAVARLEAERRMLLGHALEFFRLADSGLPLDAEGFRKLREDLAPYLAKREPPTAEELVDLLRQIVTPGHDGAAWEDLAARVRSMLERVEK